MRVDFKLPANTIADPGQRAQAKEIANSKGEVSLAAVRDRYQSLAISQENPYVDQRVKAGIPKQIADCKALEKTLLSAAAEELQLAFTAVGQHQTAGAMDAVRTQLPQLTQALLGKDVVQFEVTDLPEHLQATATQIHGWRNPKSPEGTAPYVTLPEVQSALNPYLPYTTGGYMNEATWGVYSNLESLKAHLQGQLG